MASATAHFIIGSAIALPALRWRVVAEVLPPWKIVLASGLLAAAPDLDLGGRRAFGIQPESILSHRGLFHSPFFLILVAAALAGMVALRYSRRAFARLWLLWAACMVTHPLLDAMTDGGVGVMLLIPFTCARFFFPWRPIHTPLRGTEHLLSRAFVLRPSEIPFCLLAVLIGAAGLLWRRRRLMATSDPPSA
jgi:inner membrane protein